MKLTSTLLILASAAAAQTTPTRPAATTATKPAVHHTAPAAHATTACSVEGVPAILPAAIPKITGCPKPLYSLKYVDTLVGTGTAVTARKWLTVNYTGYLLDGTKFDTSIGTDKDGKPKTPITFPYGAHQVITGWDTGFEGMNIGGKRRLYVPYQLAYGEMGRPPVIPGKSLLIFDVELVNISDTPPPQPQQPAPPRPPVTPPPASATPAPPPSTTPGAGTTPAPDGAKPAPPSPTTDPTKPTATPPPATIPHL